MFSATILPIMVVIAIGFVLKQRQFVSQDFWSAADKLAYYILFPAFLIENIATMALQDVPIFKLMLAVVVIYLVVNVALVGLQKINPMDAATFTSVYQGVARYNTYIALLIVISIWGDSYAFNVALMVSGMMIILINLQCLTVFSHYLNKESSAFTKLMLIIKNPLIVACVVGLIINIVNIPVPEFIFHAFDLLGKMALPLGLLSVGAGLIIKFNDWISYPVVLAVMGRLIAMPLLAFIVGWVVSLDEISHRVLVVLFAVPTAVSGYVLASQLGGDLRAMAKIITIQTMLSGLTLWVVLYWINETLGLS